MSLCNRPMSRTSLLVLSLFQQVMNSRLVEAVGDSAEGSLGCMSPISRYQYAFDRCVAAASLP